MAITKTTSIDVMEVRPPSDTTAGATKNARWSTVLVRYVDKIDDSGDADLPVFNYRTKSMSKFVADDGAATDYSSEDDLLKAVLNAVWT